MGEGDIEILGVIPQRGGGAEGYRKYLGFSPPLSMAARRPYDSEKTASRLSLGLPNYGPDPLARVVALALVHQSLLSQTLDRSWFRKWLGMNLTPFTLEEMGASRCHHKVGII